MCWGPGEGPDGGRAPRPRATEAILVYILDDHEVVRRGLRDLLEGEGMVVVGEIRTAAEAATRAPALRLHVAVLDAPLGDGTGPGVCRRIRSVDRRISCLVLAEDHDEQGLRDAVLAEASGYLLKQLDGHHIVAAVRRAAAGEILFGPEEEERFLSGAIEATRLKPRSFDGLGPREARVLKLLGQGMTSRQIAQAERTAKNYVSEVLTKLGLHHRTQAALHALRAERKGRTRAGVADEAVWTGSAPGQRVLVLPGALLALLGEDGGGRAWSHGRTLLPFGPFGACRGPKGLQALSHRKLPRDRAVVPAFHSARAVHRMVGAASLRAGQRSRGRARHGQAGAGWSPGEWPRDGGSSNSQLIPGAAAAARTLWDWPRIRLSPGRRSAPSDVGLHWRGGAPVIPQGPGRFSARRLLLFQIAAVSFARSSSGAVSGCCPWRARSAQS